MEMENWTLLQIVVIHIYYKIRINNCNSGNVILFFYYIFNIEKQMKQTMLKL